MAAGDFTVDQLGNVKVELQRLFKREEKPHKAVFFQELIENQSFQLTGTTTQILNGRSCQSVIGTWLKDCDETIVECASVVNDETNCVIDGDEAEAVSATYAPNLCYSRTIAVKDEECLGATSKVELTAQRLKNAIAVLDKELEKRIITFFLANRQTVAAGDIDVGAPNSGGLIWDIPASEWDPKLLAKFIIYARKKKFSNPKLLSGSNLYEDFVSSPYRGGDADKYDRILNNGEMPLFFNIFDTDTLTSENSTFIVDNDNVGYFNTRTYTNPVPQNMYDANNTHTFSVPSGYLKWRNGNTLVPIWYDVRMQRQCLNKKDYKDVFEITHEGGFALGPALCDADYKGIIHVVKDCANCV